MKGSQNFRDLQSKKKEVEDAEWVVSQPCHICKKTGLKGGYGTTTLTDVVLWSCSAACEKEMVKLRKEYYASPTRVSNECPKG